jgi:hypothetical protein
VDRVAIRRLPKLLAVGNATLAYAALNLTFRFLYWIAPVLLTCDMWTVSIRWLT